MALIMPVGQFLHVDVWTFFKMPSRNQPTLHYLQTKPTFKILLYIVEKEGFLLQKTK